MNYPLKAYSSSFPKASCSHVTYFIVCIDPPLPENDGRPFLLSQDRKLCRCSKLPLLHGIHHPDHPQLVDGVRHEHIAHRHPIGTRGADIPH